MKRVLVVIVTYNAVPWIDRCLNSLVESSIRPDVYLIDNGSTDGTQDVIQSRFPDVVFQQSCQNLGFGKANNLGLQYAIDNDYEYVYLLNQDAWLLPDTIEKLIDISSRNPDYGILSPFQMNADMIHIDNSFGRNACSWMSNPEILNDFYNNDIQEIYSVKDVMAAHWLITRKCLLQVGGFSPSFPHYAEDTNYTDRVRFWGMKVGVVPALRVVHDRAERKYSDKMGVYLNYVQGIRLISNPVPDYSHPYIALIGKFLKSSISRNSFKPMMKCMKIFVSIRKIQKNKAISMQNQCAFLKLKG